MTLPEKLSDLLELAVRDAQACENDPRYRIDMEVWHEPDSHSRCLVCMAGAVMAQSLGLPPGGGARSRTWAVWSPGDYSKDVTLALWAIDSMRMGGVPVNFEDDHETRERIIKALEPVRTYYDPGLGRAQWAVYKEAARALRRAGL